MYFYSVNTLFNLRLVRKQTIYFEPEKVKFFVRRKVYTVKCIRTAIPEDQSRGLVYTSFEPPMDNADE